MARGIRVPPDEFVAPSEPQKSLIAQITFRGRVTDFYELDMHLPNPNPILGAQERDIHIYHKLCTNSLVGGCICRRKAVLKSLERGLGRGHTSARVSRLIRDIPDDLNLPHIIGEMSDAVLYGYQPCEIMWGRSVRAWAMVDIVGKPPEWFQFDTDSRLRFRARNADVEGELLSPLRFMVPAQDVSYGNLYGFLDPSMYLWSVASKKGGMKFWPRLTGRFDSSWAIGKHLRGANGAEVEKPLNSMEQVVEDMVAAIPDDSSIELKATGGKADNSEVFRKLITLSHSEISTALLGQNQITGANSNKASAQAGLEVTADIRDTDADTTQAAVNQVIRTVVTPNLGDVPCPVWAMWEQEIIDDTHATRDEKLTRAGLRLIPQHFKRKYQLQDGDTDEASSSECQNNMLPLLFAEVINADIQTQQQSDDALDILMNRGVLNGTLGPVLAPLFKRVEDKVNPTELLGELAELHPQMNMDDPQERLARILFVVNIWGCLRECDNGRAGVLHDAFPEVGGRLSEVQRVSDYLGLGRNVAGGPCLRLYHC